VKCTCEGEIDGVIVRTAVTLEAEGGRLRAVPHMGRGSNGASCQNRSAALVTESRGASDVRDLPGPREDARPHRAALARVTPAGWTHRADVITEAGGGACRKRTGFRQREPPW
jgi:hypothetical protein